MFIYKGLINGLKKHTRPEGTFFSLTLGGLFVPAGYAITGAWQRYAAQCQEAVAMGCDVQSCGSITNSSAPACTDDQIAVLQNMPSEVTAGDVFTSMAAGALTCYGLYLGASLLKACCSAQPKQSRQSLIENDV
jgi:hypothetical protein